MQQTLTGQSIAPPESSPNGIPDDMSSYDDAIKKAEEGLTGILNQYPDVDYMGKYKEILNQVQNRPVDEPANPALSFAYALGSPQNAPGILERGMMKRAQQQEQKEHDMMVLQENLLQGAIQQEIAKGNFKTALTQAVKLSELQESIGQKHRAQDLKDWKEKQGIKAKDAKDIADKKIRALIRAHGMTIDERERLAITTAFATTLGRMASHPDMLGNFPDVETLADQYAPNILEMLRAAIAKKSGDGVTTPNAGKPETDAEKRRRIAQDLEKGK